MSDEQERAFTVTVPVSATVKVVVYATDEDDALGQADYMAGFSLGGSHTLSDFRVVFDDIDTGAAEVKEGEDFT